MPQIYALSDVDNPGLAADAIVHLGASDNLARVEAFLNETRPQLVVVGPEEPLEAGVADLLANRGIACVGPLRDLARIESSKSFTRELFSEYDIPGNVEYQVFKNEEGLKEYLRDLGEFVVKPDGLTGGKGVKVFGEHLASVSDALNYCREIFANGSPVVIEEKLDGEEFSFQSFFDGWHSAHTFPIQDHKRAHVGDTGPNTGGMGSYSFPDHLLPFLNEAHIREASEINQLVGEALFKKTKKRYKGILYGGFMLTKKGLRVIEYNARFGDPEAMNVLPLLETDFLDICEAIVSGTLDKLKVKFAKKATVCKYIVPSEYPGKSTSKDIVDVSRLEQLVKSESRLRAYYGAVDHDGENYRLTGSRAIALLGIGETLQEAELVAEQAACLVRGPVYHRWDIGTPSLIQKRIDHMARINEKTTGDREHFTWVKTSGDSQLARRIG
ncbi:MAG: phosphoribosylamine---glycine ligase [Bradyrhizobium sp.]|nr:phosphoribosylamine---glycine ligase [Bradyrhizobium sp.]